MGDRGNPGEALFRILSSFFPCLCLRDVFLGERFRRVTVHAIYNEYEVYFMVAGVSHTKTSNICKDIAPFFFLYHFVI